MAREISKASENTSASSNIRLLPKEPYPDDDKLELRMLFWFILLLKEDVPKESSCDRERGRPIAALRLSKVIEDLLLELAPVRPPVCRRR